MVRWYVEKKLFSLTLDNANANEVAVNDAIVMDFFPCEMCLSCAEFSC
jgi:hypothetical protein